LGKINFKTLIETNGWLTIKMYD